MIKFHGTLSNCKNRENYVAQKLLGIRYLAVKISFQALPETLANVFSTHLYIIKFEIAQVSSSFKWLDMRTSMSTTPTLITEALRRVTSLAYSYRASFHAAYICLRHAH